MFTNYLRHDAPTSLKKEIVAIKPDLVKNNFFHPPVFSHRIKVVCVGSTFAKGNLTMRFLRYCHTLIENIRTQLLLLACTPSR